MMQLNKNNLDNGTIGTDLSYPWPFMAFHNIPRPSVGADLSCPPPLYRPRWSFHYLDKKGKQHHWVPTMEKSNVAFNWIQLR